MESYTHTSSIWTWLLETIFRQITSSLPKVLWCYGFEDEGMLSRPMFRCRLGTANLWGTLCIVDIMDLPICYDSWLECGNTVLVLTKSIYSKFSGKWRWSVLRKRLPFLICTSTPCWLVVVSFFGSFYASLQETVLIIILEVRMWPRAIERYNLFNFHLMKMKKEIPHKRCVFEYHSHLETIADGCVYAALFSKWMISNLRIWRGLPTLSPANTT